MARKITIPLSDALEAKIQAQVHSRGLSFDEYILSVLTEAVSGPPRIPADLAELEAELLKGREGPDYTLTPQDWERKKAEFVARHSRSKAG